MYNFDEVIDRRHTNALNTDGFRDYIFHADETMTFPYKDEEFIRMWVADMEFATPDVVVDGWSIRSSVIPGYLKNGITTHFPPGVSGTMIFILTGRSWSCPMGSFRPFMNWWNTSVSRMKKSCSCRRPMLTLSMRLNFLEENLFAPH